MQNLKQLLENVIAEAINDPQESIPTDKLPSAIVIAERITKLEEALADLLSAWQHQMSLYEDQPVAIAAKKVLYNK